MDVFLSFNDNTDVLRLPVLPSSYKIKTGNNNSVVDITDFGELNLIGNSKLAEITIERFFPAREYSFCKYTGFPGPYESVGKIESWRLSKKPIRLLITGTPINMPCSIESFEYGEQDGTGDVYYSLALKEYKYLEAPESLGNYSVGTGSSSVTDYDIIDLTDRGATKTKTAIKVNSYTVQTGDTLEDICTRAYGEYNATTKAKLLKLNPDIVSGTGLFKQAKLTKGITINIKQEAETVSTNSSNTSFPSEYKALPDETKIRPHDCTDPEQRLSAILDESLIPANAKHWTNNKDSSPNNIDYVWLAIEIYQKYAPVQVHGGGKVTYRLRVPALRVTTHPDGAVAVCRVDAISYTPASDSKEILSPCKKGVIFIDKALMIKDAAGKSTITTPHIDSNYVEKYNYPAYFYFLEV